MHISHQHTGQGLTLNAQGGASPTILCITWVCTVHSLIITHLKEELRSWIIIGCCNVLYAPDEIMTRDERPHATEGIDIKPDHLADRQLLSFKPTHPTVAHEQSAASR